MAECETDIVKHARPGARPILRIAAVAAISLGALAWSAQMASSRDRVNPRSILEQDARAIEVMARNTDLSVPLAVEHVLYVPSREAAASLIAELRGLGFRTEWKRPDQGRSNWLVVATHRAVLTLELLTRTRLSLEKLAAKVGGEYDGWGAAVPRDGETPAKRN